MVIRIGYFEFYFLPNKNTKVNFKLNFPKRRTFRRFRGLKACFDMALGFDSWLYCMSNVCRFIQFIKLKSSTCFIVLFLSLNGFQFDL